MLFFNGLDSCRAYANRLSSVVVSLGQTIYKRLPKKLGGFPAKFGFGAQKLQVPSAKICVLPSVMVK